MISGKDQQNETMDSKDPLLQSFKLRHLTLKNRIKSTSHTMLYAVDGARQQRYVVKRAVWMWTNYLGSEVVIVRA